MPDSKDHRAEIPHPSRIELGPGAAAFTLALDGPAEVTTACPLRLRDVRPSDGSTDEKLSDDRGRAFLAP